MIKVMRLNSDAQLPKSSHPGTSLAWDIYSTQDVVVNPGEIVKVSTGIAVQFEGPMQIGFLLRERSGHAVKGIKLLGGVIDADYQGEWLVILGNFGQDLFKVSIGDRIAQAIAMPTLTGLPVEWVDKFLQKTERSDSGFGSTGVR